MAGHANGPIEFFENLNRPLQIVRRLTNLHET
ncbi:hypothetical protein ABH995_004903 [Bradyrhizobium yuanmingense]